MAVSGAAFATYLLVLSPAAGPRVGLPPRPTPQPIAVQVAGEVQQPGVYQVSAALRVEDAIRLAGGATAEGDPGQLNLAARVTDGQRIAVPRRPLVRGVGEPASPAEDSAAEPRPSLAPRPARLNVNVATFAELDALPGIGTVTAQKILEQRQKAPFTSVDQLAEMKIVTGATLARIRDLITAE